MTQEPGPSANTRQAYIVGGGIAGLAAAAYLVRDGGMPGESIHVLEQSDLFGGSLDGAGDPDSGYAIRGGRMFEEHFGCTFDLLSTIPSLSDPAVSASDELHAFTRRVVTSSKCRIVADGERIEAPPLGLNRRDQWDLARLSLLPERFLGSRTIEDYFRADFFESNFWIMWCTMFAFQPWHSLIEFRRYMRRFMHLMPGFNRLEGIHRTLLNQYDSIVRPLVRWLEQAGVDLQTNVSVMDLDFSAAEDRAQTVTGIRLETNGQQQRIDVGSDDLVLLTLGSMTEDSSLGTMETPAAWRANPDQGAWGLWKNIARKSSAFGKPDAFCGDVSRSRWESFTVTLKDPYFFEFMEEFTGNPAGTGGLVTFSESNWLMSVVLAYQPHFSNQPDDVWVFWGYGLHPERRGNRVDKPMIESGGREILTELCHHLPVGDAGDRIIDSANCIPCAMPFITSQFMPRAPGDRPQVVPAGARNFAFLGQFCEVPDDTVFTVEYSVRTAQMAVYELLGLNREATPMYRGYLRPSVVLRALRALA
ncbi:MAG: oleate hydratase [Gammaproteobacteria bacterium]|jgi:oleate hydratase